jgi:hypothetical protein
MCAAAPRAFARFAAPQHEAADIPGLFATAIMPRARRIVAKGRFMNCLLKFECALSESVKILGYISSKLAFVLGDNVENLEHVA